MFINVSSVVSKDRCSRPFSAGNMQGVKCFYPPANKNAALSFMFSSTETVIFVFAANDVHT